MSNPRLLVSVRNADEAGEAIAGGAALIDVKEPLRGPMGRPDDETVQNVASRVAGRRPLSMAFGELVDWNREPPVELISKVTFVKFGLAGCLLEPRWCDWLNLARDLFNDNVGDRVIVVAYADWETALAPMPSKIVEFAIAHRLAGVLIDTYDKNSRTLLDAADLDDLATWGVRLRNAGASYALAGSLGPTQISELHRVDADWIGVRGSVCADHSRTGRIERRRVAALVDQLAAFSKPENTPCETPL